MCRRAARSGGLRALRAALGKVSSATADLSSSPRPSATRRSYCALLAAAIGSARPCSRARSSAMPESLAAWAAEK